MLENVDEQRGRRMKETRRKGRKKRVGGERGCMGKWGSTYRCNIFIFSGHLYNLLTSIENNESILGFYTLRPLIYFSSHFFLHSSITQNLSHPPTGIPIIISINREPWETQTNTLNFIRCESRKISKRWIFFLFSVCSSDVAGDLIAVWKIDNFLATLCVHDFYVGLYSFFLFFPLKIHSGAVRKFLKEFFRVTHTRWAFHRLSRVHPRLYVYIVYRDPIKSLDHEAPQGKVIFYGIMFREAIRSL